MFYSVLLSGGDGSYQHDSLRLLSLPTHPQHRGFCRWEIRGITAVFIGVWVDQDSREAPSCINDMGFRFWTLSDLSWQLHICFSNFQVAKHILEDEVKVLVAQLCLTLCDPMDCSPPRLLCPWDSPGKNNGEGSHSLLQGIFPTQGSNRDLSHCRQILYCLSHQGSSEFGKPHFNGTECSMWFHIWIKSKMWTVSQKTSLLTRSVLLESLLPVLAKWLSVYH